MLFLGNYTSNIATKKFFFILGFRAIGIKFAENKDYLQQDLFKRASKLDEWFQSILQVKLPQGHTACISHDSDQSTCNVS